ncbi:MAG: hypothetical protein EXS14_10280 [Planctomycetes bacterium]|nr:hypothetical protein [Planctomycetota bacterium]
MQKKTVSREETVNFVAAILGKNSAATAAEITKAGKAKGLNIYPLIFGLARKQLGIGPKVASGRGPGRPRKIVLGAASGAFKAAASVARKVAAPKLTVSRSTTSMSGDIRGVIDHISSLDAEVTRLRGLLNQISSIAGV